jgi:hypothetical protein
MRSSMTLRALLVVTVFLLPSVTLAETGDSEHYSIFGIVYLGLFFAAAVVVLVFIFLSQRRERNPHTGLSRPIKRRRARGPLKSGRAA